MREQMLIFLDFDGVICDSVHECFLAAWKAYFEDDGFRSAAGWNNSPPDSVPLEWKRRFDYYRPYIRNGEDYLALFRVLEEGMKIADQESFDRIMEKFIGEERQNIRERFYKARESLIEQDFSRWLYLNPLFPGIGEILQRNHTNKQLFILSTKRPDFIMKILSFHGIEWNQEKILFAADIPKARFIHSVIEREGAVRAVFIDDQISHLLGVSGQEIRCLLPNWGYIKPEWPQLYGIEAVGVEDLSRIIEEATGIQSV
ncbi:MAG: hypothetical protein K9L68_02725 [Spirochaetales bacterium]|nr:hypothetical protein [Spirochaetales bacterium]MCF7937491.1 hypothetical protein [Spirochaetales bacterium]